MTKETPSTQKILKGADYKLFKGLRYTFRTKRVNGIIDQETIHATHKAFDISEDEAGAILSGQIFVEVNESTETVTWDSQDLADLYAAVHDFVETHSIGTGE